MNVLVILIPVSIMLGGLGLAAFVWTVRNGQYEDEAGTSARILLDDDEDDDGEDDDDDDGEDGAR